MWNLLILFNMGNNLKTVLGKKKLTLCWPKKWTRLWTRYGGTGERLPVVFSG